MNSSLRPWIFVVVGIVLVGLASVTFWFLQARNIPSADSCINKLRLIEGAKDQWAAENQKTTNDLPTWAELTVYWGKHTPGCPQGGTYTLAPVGAPDTCSILEHSRVWKEARPSGDSRTP